MIFFYYIVKELSTLLLYYIYLYFPNVFRIFLSGRMDLNQREPTNLSTRYQREGIRPVYQICYTFSLASDRPI